MSPPPDSSPISPFASRPPATRVWSGRLWLALWLLLAVAHVTQAIWLSGGAARPGDLGDGRFNGLVLEHGYQALRGVYPWTSPGQFFPVRHTLGYSDTHAGTLPLYALTRFLGCPPGRAWQLWFVLVAALNALGAARFFRALDVDACLRGPLVFAATASAVMVWLAGTHAQLLPLFPGLLAAAELVRWREDRRHFRLLLATGWSAWQFAATPYGAFFFAVILGFTALARAVVPSPRPAAPPPAGPTLPIEKVYALLVVAAGAILAGFALVAYAAARQAGQGREWHEVVDLAPTVRAWFTAPPVHAFYTGGWPGRDPDSVEHAWFAGFLPWLGTLAAIVAGWRGRRSSRGALLFAFAAGALATALFFTRWNAEGGAWTTLAFYIEPLRAIRASGRVAAWVQLAEVSAIALVLAAWHARCRATRHAWLPVAAAVALALEGIAWRQPATALATESRRTDALVDAWRAAGDRPVLAFAPGYTNQPIAWLHLDAWSAALRLGRATLNGYSGGVPGSHLPFWWQPGVAQARALIDAESLDPDRVSIVQRLAPADAAALGLVQFASQPVFPLDDFAPPPVAWTLFAPLERFLIDGQPAYQFTPPAEVRFALPDSARAVEFLVGLRDGAYTGSGHSDGVQLTCTLETPAHAPQTLWDEHFDPAAQPQNRGLVARRIPLPAAKDRVFVLRTGFGPSGDGRWDWPLFARFRAN